MTQDSAVAEKVTQEDREVAAAIYELLGFGPCQHIIDGIEDDIGVVQISARHRIAAHTAGRLEGMREGTPEGMVLVPRELLAKFKQEAERFTAATPDAMPVEICAITQPGWQYVLTMGDIRVLATSIRALQEKHNG